MIVLAFGHGPRHRLCAAAQLYRLLQDAKLSQRHDLQPSAPVKTPTQSDL